MCNQQTMSTTKQPRAACKKKSSDFLLKKRAATEPHEHKGLNGAQNEVHPQSTVGGGGGSESTRATKCLHLSCTSGVSSTAGRTTPCRNTAAASQRVNCTSLLLHVSYSCTNLLFLLSKRIKLDPQQHQLHSFSSHTRTHEERIPPPTHPPKNPSPRTDCLEGLSRAT